MALADGFPSASGTVSAQELRLNLAGLITRSSAGVPRLGILPRSSAAIVSVRSDMKVDVAAFEAVVGRSGQGVIFLANDGTLQVTIPAAPVSNSRYDVVYLKQDDNVSPNADADNLPTLGVQSGAASPTPSKATVLAAIPAGAIPIAALLIPSGVSATNAGSVVLTQEYQYTSLTGAPIWVRNSTELVATSGYPAGTKAWQIDNGSDAEFNGTVWASSPVLDMNGVIPAGFKPIWKRGVASVVFTSGSGTLTYPTPFPNACVSAIATGQAGVGLPLSILAAVGGALPVGTLPIANYGSVSGTFGVHYDAIGY